MCEREKEGDRDTYSWGEWVKSRAAGGETDSCHELLQAKRWVQIWRHVLLQTHIRNCVDTTKSTQVNHSNRHLTYKSIQSTPTYL